MAARPGSRNGIYLCIALTGGGVQALDSLQITGVGTPNTYDLIDGDAAMVVIDGNFYCYRFDATSTEAESSPDYIRPDDYVDGGVWELITYGESPSSSATGFFDSGTIEHERGGLELDVAGFEGILAISGGSTYELNSLAELEAIVGSLVTPSEAQNYVTFEQLESNDDVGTSSDQVARGDHDHPPVEVTPTAFTFTPQSDGGLALHGRSATALITATASITVPLSIPAGCMLIGCQIRVNTALDSADNWDAAWDDGSTIQAITSNQSYQTNTKVDSFFNANSNSNITDAETNVVITKNGGGSFTAQGEIFVRAYYYSLQDLEDHSYVGPDLVDSYSGFNTNYCRFYYDGEYLYAYGGGSSGYIKAFSIVNDELSLLASYGVGSSITNRGISGDGTYIYITNSSGHFEALTFNGSSFTQVCEDTANTAYAYAIACRTTGEIFFQGSYNGAAGNIVLTFNGSAFTYQSLASNTYSFSSNTARAETDGTYYYSFSNETGHGCIQAFTYSAGTLTLQDTYNTYTWGYGLTVGNGYIFASNYYTNDLWALTFDGSSFNLVASTNAASVSSWLSFNSYTGKLCVLSDASTKGFKIYDFDGSSFTEIGSATSTPTAYSTYCIVFRNYIAYAFTEIGGVDTGYLDLYLFY